MKNIINKSNLLNAIGIDPKENIGIERSALNNYGYSISEYEYNIPFKYFKNINFGKKLVIVKSKNVELFFNDKKMVINLKNCVLEKIKKYDDEIIKYVVFIEKKETKKSGSLIETLINENSSKLFLKEFDSHKILADDKLIEEYGEDLIFDIQSEEEHMSLLIKLYKTDLLLPNTITKDIYLYTILLIMKKNKNSIEVSVLNDLIRILELIHRKIK